METLSRSIAVVDDETDIRDSTVELLRAWGHGATGYDSAAAFLEHAFSDSFAAALIDVRMHPVDGLMLVSQLRAAGSTLPTMIMTAHGDLPVAVGAMRAGAQDFIEKPFDDIELMRRLDAIMHCGPQVMMGVPMSAPPAEPAATEAVDEINEPAANPFCDLTPRELDVMLEMVRGDPNKVIAHRLGVSPKTVEIHRARVMEKAGARNFSHLVRMALKAGYDPDDHE
ncbi:MAG: response regulator [Pseudomonadota bacterium]